MVWGKYCEVGFEKGPQAFRRNWFSWSPAALGKCSHLAAIENLTVQSHYDGSALKGQWCCTFWSFCGGTGVTAGILSPPLQDFPHDCCHAAVIPHTTVCSLPIFHTWVPLHPWCCSEWFCQCKQWRVVCPMYATCLDLLQKLFWTGIVSSVSILL